MHIPYHTRRRLERLGAAFLLLLTLAVLIWLCWVVWLERYVVYTRDGAQINLDLDPQLPVGQVALPPDEAGFIDIFYNEGLNAVETSTELVQLRGYYIDKDALKDLAANRQRLGALATDTPVMIELKNIDGTFNYPSELSDATFNGAVDMQGVKDLIHDMTSGKFYTIAKISTFRDRNYGLNHVTCGLPIKGGGGVLWPDEKGCYWLDPTDPYTLNWIISVINEVKAMGFNEVVLGEFRFPATDKIIFDSDKAEALRNAMNIILEKCASETFTISFCVSDPGFELPEGSRTRIYMEGVAAEVVGSTAAQATVDNPEVRLVFISATNDTRYDQYGVLRPIASSDVLEERNR